jgi:hypothetical protein
MFSHLPRITLAAQEGLAVTRLALYLSLNFPYLSYITVLCLTRPYTCTCSNMYHQYRNAVSSNTHSGFECNVLYQLTLLWVSNSD